MTQDRTGDRPTSDAEHWMDVTRQVQALAVKVQSCRGHGSPRLSKSIREPQLHWNQNTAVSQYRQR